MSCFRCQSSSFSVAGSPVGRALLNFLTSHLPPSRCLHSLRLLSGLLSGLPDLVLWVEARLHLSGFGQDQTCFLPTDTKRVSPRACFCSTHSRRNGLVCLNDSVLVRFCLGQSQRQVCVRSRLAQAVESSIRLSLRPPLLHLSVSFSGCFWTSAARVCLGFSNQPFASVSLSAQLETSVWPSVWPPRPGLVGRGQTASVWLWTGPDMFSANGYKKGESARVLLFYTL